MKKIALLTLVFGITVTTLTSFSYEPINKIENSISKQYRVTAYTKKDVYGNSQWVDLIVEADVTDYSTLIYGFYYDDGYGLKKLTKYNDYEYKDTYYVFINSKQFYFTF